MKKILALVLAMLMILAAGSAIAEQSDFEYIKAKGTLVVGMTLFPPMNYYDQATGEFVGFDTELALAVGEKLGVAVEFVEIHRDHGLDAGIELGKLELHPFDDQAVVVRDEHFHCGTFMAGCLRACHVERGGARMAVTIFRARSGHQAASAMPTA